MSMQQMTAARLEETLQKYAQMGAIERKKHMRRRNHAFSSFPTKHLAKSVKFDGYVSREDRNAPIDFFPEGAPAWKYYPKKENVSPSAR